jgi:ankyrin repeat protein
MRNSGFALRLLYLSLTSTLLAAPVRTVFAADSAIADAAERQDRAAVTRLLAQHVPVNAAQADGTTALHWAAHWNDVQTVDALIKSGANVNAANRHGVTPLLLACTSGQALPVIQRLLNAGADANTASGDNETALMLAARAGNVAAIKALLAFGADPNAAEGWRGQTALMWAAAENQRDAVKTLIEGGARLAAVSKTQFTPLLFAVRAGHLDTVRELLNAGGDPNDVIKDGTSALTIAAMNAHWELGELLLAWGADPNGDAQGWGPLHQVALTRSPHHDNVAPQPIPTGSVDSLDFVKALLAYGANVNLRTVRSPTDGFRQWIRREGATAFVLAAKAADVPLLHLLVDSGADPNIPTKQHVTALAAAAGVGFCQGESPGTESEAMEAVKYTLALGGDVNAADDDGFTPMHGAATRGANTIVQFLYDRGARLDPKSKEDGWTPWTMANGVMLANTYKRQLETADYLKRLMDRTQ